MKFLSILFGGTALIPLVNSAPSSPIACRNPSPSTTCSKTSSTVKTWTVDFDDLPAGLGISANRYLPLYYGGVNWAYEYRRVDNTSTNSLTYYNDPRGPIAPPSGENFLTNPGNTLTIVADEYEDRFGVKEFWVLCQFWPDKEGEEYNGKGCDVTVVGRRDPYEESGLPEKVEAKITIPNPGKATGESRKFTKVSLDELTEEKGKFEGLYRFDVYTEQGSVKWGVSAGYDSFVFTREEKDDSRCSSVGTEVLDFDDVPANASLPETYHAMLFPSSQWKTVSPVSAYPPSTSPTSVKNALFASLDRQQSYATFSSPDTSSPLFDFASITITLAISPTNYSALADLRIAITVSDSCGKETLNTPDYLSNSRTSDSNKLDWFYQSTIYPFASSTTAQAESNQFLFARPYKAISSFGISVEWKPDSEYYGNGEKVEFWIDDVRYRISDVKRVECIPCGYRAGERCEKERIPR